MFLHFMRTRLAVSEIKRQYKIYYYARYVDDIFIVADMDDVQFDSFLSSWRQKSDPYLLKVEYSHALSAPMLDSVLSLFGGLARMIPYRKPTGQRVWLSSESAHHGSIHRSWPACQIERLEK